jgi:hypothetical protein
MGQDGRQEERPRRIEAELARAEAMIDAMRELAERDLENSWKEAVETQRWLLSSGLAANLAGTWAMLTAASLTPDLRMSCLWIFTAGIVFAFLAGIVRQWQSMHVWHGYNRIVRHAVALRYGERGAPGPADSPPPAPSTGLPRTAMPQVTLGNFTSAVLPFAPIGLFLWGVFHALSDFAPVASAP